MLSNDEIRALAVAAFGEWAMCRLESAQVRDAIAHEPTRRFLTDVGLPVQGPFFHLDTDFLVQPTLFADHVADGYFQPGEAGGPLRRVMVGRRALAQWGRLLRIGDSGEHSLWLDPDTGAVCGFAFTWDQPPCLVNSGTAELVASLAHVERQRFVDGVPLEELEDVDLAYDLLETVTKQLAELDPPAFECCEDGGFWAGWLDDPLAWGGLDWELDDDAVAFLHARGQSRGQSRGIEPAEHEPRRPAGD